jgi:hypothetical protein
MTLRPERDQLASSPPPQSVVRQTHDRVSKLFALIPKRLRSTVTFVGLLAPRLLAAVIIAVSLFFFLIFANLALALRVTARHATAHISVDRSDAMTRMLINAAVHIAGRKREWRAEEWMADSPPGAQAFLRHAAGLLIAAIRFRVTDTFRTTERVLDWTLAEPRTEILIAVATLCSAGYFLRTAGVSGLMSNADNVLATAALTCGPAYWLRKARGVPPKTGRRRRNARRR